MNKTKIYGHRGSKGSYPENTLLSFYQAILQGVDGLELDVHMTKDGEIVVIHDEVLDRTTDGAGFIKDYSLQEIKQFSAGIRFSDYKRYEISWVLETVPTLQEVLELLEPYDIELNIELKTNVFTYEGIEEKILAIVNEYGNNRKVVYSSFHLPSLIRIKQVDKSAHIAWLLNQSILNPQDYLDSLELEAFHLNKKIVLLDQENWKNLKQNIRLWTVNDLNELRKLIEMNVEAIITDFPEEAIAVRKGRMVGQ
jgi:glycerophosphoryl diester phosphodiesterase